MWALTLLSLVAVLVPFGHGGKFYQNHGTPKDYRQHYNIDIFSRLILQGYWFNDCNDTLDRSVSEASPTCMQIKDVPDYYNVIAVAFMKSENYGDIPTFSPNPATGMNDENFLEQVTELNANGQAVVILSLGGKDSNIRLEYDQVDLLKDKIILLANKYGFNGLDINLEESVIEHAGNARTIINASKYVKNHFNRLVSASPDYQKQYFIIALSEKLNYRCEGRYNVYLNSLLEDTFDCPKNSQWLDYVIYDMYNADLRLIQYTYHGKNRCIDVPFQKMVHGVKANKYLTSRSSEVKTDEVRGYFNEKKDAGTPLRGLSIWTINWEKGTYTNGTQLDTYVESFFNDMKELYHGVSF